MKQISKIFGLFISLLFMLGIGVVFAQSMAEMGVTNGWIRATPPNAKMGAAYLTVMNHQDQADDRHHTCCCGVIPSADEIRYGELAELAQVGGE